MSLPDKYRVQVIAEPSPEVLKDLFAVELSAHIDPWSIDQIEACFDPCTEVLGLYQKHELLGFAVVRVILDEAELFTIGIKTAFQGQGLGRMLLESALAACVRRGARCCFLEVRESNAPALALYRRCGFTQIGLRARYYRACAGHPAENAITMRWDYAGGDNT